MIKSRRIVLLLFINWRTNVLKEYMKKGFATTS